MYLLLDSYSLFFRAYHALPEMTTQAGLPTNALYGFSSLLLKLLRELEPTGVALARDLPKKTFRHEQYTDYKAGRAPLAPSLVTQLELFGELATATGFPMFSVEGFEADDVLATLAARLAAQGSNVLVVSGDRDLLQLVNDAVSVLFVGQRGKAPVRYDRARVLDRFGVGPEQLPLYVALVGDASDNIPKVKGIGPKTASALLRGCADAADAAELLARLDQAPPKLRALVSQHADQILRSEALVRLRRDVPLDERLPTPFDAAARARTARLFELWEFKSLQARLDALKA